MADEAKQVMCPECRNPFSHDWPYRRCPYCEVEAKEAELAALQRRCDAQQEALEGLVAKEPRHVEFVRQDDTTVWSCSYCDGYMDEMNRVFLHDESCPWLQAQRLAALSSPVAAPEGAAGSRQEGEGHD